MDDGIPEPQSSSDQDHPEESTNDRKKEAVSSALRCCGSVLAFVIPLAYGLLYGADTSWHWTALYSWLFFFICHPVDKEKIMCSLIVWSVVAFVFWMIIYAVSKVTAFIYIGMYFLLNGLILFGVALRSICQRHTRDAYESI